MIPGTENSESLVWRRTRTRPSARIRSLKACMSIDARALPQTPRALHNPLIRSILPSDLCHPRVSRRLQSFIRIDIINLPSTRGNLGHLHRRILLDASWCSPGSLCHLLFPSEVDLLTSLTNLFRNWVAVLELPSLQRRLIVVRVFISPYCRSIQPRTPLSRGPFHSLGN